MNPASSATPSADILAALRDMLGPGVGAAVTDPRAPTGPLWPEETPAIARAIPKRRDEFTAGRDAARAAMRDLGVTPAAIPQGADRAPIWPAELTGSIAHCDHICIAAVAPIKECVSLGLDIEPATPLADDLIPTVCTAGERRWLEAHPNPGLAAKKIFCAKEAVYKAQYPLSRTLIGFDAVEITFSPEQTLFSAVIDPEFITTRAPLSGQICLVGDYFLATSKY
ncbi:MAG: 4'-phosphopantetheinyl transferase superfamily protein [Pseudomonadota bacterium]